jgi:hypothetical protein
VDGDISGKMKTIISVLYDKQAAQYVTTEKRYLLQYLHTKEHLEVDVGFAEQNLDNLAYNSNNDIDDTTIASLTGDYIEDSVNQESQDDDSTQEYERYPLFDLDEVQNKIVP